MGETVVNLVREKDKYKIIAEKGIGSLKIDGKEQSGETSQGDSKDIIKIEGGIGSIKVNFK
ncbi:MAG: hypothetical protein HFJ52_02385 [Clostridia bacterium]|jgi:hypothetical protein|nr:hypothetical protein [Clostridia bacterium]